MKKLLLNVEGYLTHFWFFVMFSSGVLVFIVWLSPIYLWVGNQMGGTFKDLVGGLFLEFLSLEYLLLLFYVLLPLAGVFLLLSLYFWVGCKKDKEISHKGLSGVVIGALAVFFMMILPMMGANKEIDVRSYRSEVLVKYYENGTSVKTTGNEIFKLYQQLVNDDMQTWRKDPLKVVEYEMEKGGALSSINKEGTQLELLDKKYGNNNERSEANVLLTNNIFKINIILDQPIKRGEEGIWRVKQYKRK